MQNLAWMPNGFCIKGSLRSVLLRFLILILVSSGLCLCSGRGEDTTEAQLKLLYIVLLVTPFFLYCNLLPNT